MIHAAVTRGGLLGLCGLLLCWTNPAWAYQPSLEELITRSLNDGAHVTRLIVRSRSAVFDPFKQTEKSASSQARVMRIPGVGDDEPLSAHQPDRAFQQITYWVRDELLAVETVSAAGEALHFYFREAPLQVSEALHPQRRFAEEDLHLAYLPFVASHPQRWREGMRRWGLEPLFSRLVRTPKGHVFYSLEETPGKSLWLERKEYLPVRLETRLEGDFRPLVIEFSEFLKIKHPEKRSFYFPRTTNYLWEGMLFKQTTVTTLLVNPSWKNFPLTRLRKQARSVADSQNAANPGSGREVKRP